MDVALLSSLDPASMRALLPGYLSGFFADEQARESNCARVTELVETWDDATCAEMLGALMRGGEAMALYPADLQGRVLSRTWSEDAVVSWSVEGIEHLRCAAADGPVVILCNHLSYYDATATDAILAWAGETGLADRLLFAAGPKVYQHLFRRVAAGCLNTVKVPQSTRIAHTARIPARELAQLARSSMEAATEGMRNGMILLLYPEGSRTRTGRMGSYIKGVHRYLSALPEIRVVPMTITGTDRLMSVDDDERIVPSTVGVTFEAPLSVGENGTSREVLIQVHQRIAQMLPEEHRPESGTEPLA